MDVHHLRYFVEVAHAGTIAAAGRSLAVSASPLSRRIADLERYMGGPLFVRGGRRLELTESGSALLPVDHAAPLVRVRLTVPVLATTWLVWRRDRSDLQVVIEAVRAALRAPSRTDPVRPADQIGC